jgi:hypothetical protein
MRKILFALVIFVALYACKPGRLSGDIKNKQIWVFIMAGQSNMAGRGLIEAQDTVTNARILTINKNYQIISAKEPIHFYEPSLKGLDCGLSFAQTLIKELDKSINILIIPTAIGGSSSRQWLGDSVHRNVQLLTNFRQKMEFAKTQGIIKGILWHQGESDADKLPILIGELGAYSKTPAEWNSINEIIREYVDSDADAYLIGTHDLKHKGDFIHFDSEGQRLMGRRFAETYLKLVK